MNAAKLLRQKILDLAIRGKLTKREKGDGSVVDFLSYIAAEKQRLVDEKKIKKEKPIPPIADDEIPFDLPKKWAWRRLGDVVAFIATGPFGSMLHKSDYVSDGIPLVNPMHIVDGKIAPSSNAMVSERTALRLCEYRLEAGMVVLGRRGEMGRCALVTEKEEGWLCGTGSFFIKPLSCIDRGYLLLLLSSRYAKGVFEGDSIGTTMFNLNHGILKRLPVPLPPLAEQKRIVTRVDELLAEVGKYSAAMDALAASSEMMEKKVLDLAIRGKLTKREKGDEPAAALLARIAAEKQKLIAAKKLRKLDAYDPISDEEIPFDELPSGWSWCRFGEVIDYVQPTEYIVRDTNYDDSYSTPVLTAGQSFVLGYTNEKDHHFKASKESPVIIFDDFTTSTQWVDFEFKVKSSAMKILVPYEGCDICMRYVFMAIRNNPFRPSTHARHWIDKFAKFVLPLPPLEEQKRIVARVDELLAECRKMRGE